MDIGEPQKIIEIEEIELPAETKPVAEPVKEPIREPIPA
jgi:hypothetical protein